MKQPIGLKRSLSLPMITLYGLGTTIGAGIYALVGEIAAYAGYHAPLSFIIASILAGFTAISFAELSSRYPQAASAALYVQNSFDSRKLASIIGLMVIFAGLVSAAALINGFWNHIQAFFSFSTDRITVLISVTVLLGIIAAWGIIESVMIAATVTVIEIGGLLLVLFVSNEAIMSLPTRWAEIAPPLEIDNWTGIMFGAVLSFYAFIGFEDMVDVAEEVKDVRRNLPVAIILTLAITTLLYVLLMLAAVLSLPPQVLTSSDVALAELYAFNSGKDASVILIIGMFAIINGALIQMIMASRVIYGLSKRGQLPALFAIVHKTTRTPLLATAASTITVVILAVVGSLATLAEMTSMIILIIFCFVNLSLWRLKITTSQPVDIVNVSVVIPILGFLVSFAFVSFELFHRVI
jgi:amino acid transporter